MDGEADLATQQRVPPQTWASRLRQVGPGIIITASIVGSGELILTTKLGAEVGFTFLWFIILGCMVKVFVQVELGRYTVSAGTTTLETLNRMPGPRLVVSWIVWLWLIMYIAVFFQVSGIVGGIADVFTPRLSHLAETAPLPVGENPDSGVAQDRLPRFQEAMAAYEQGEHLAAARVLEELKADGETAPGVGLYLGICELQNERAKKATEALEASLERAQGPLRQDGLWYLGTANLLRGDLAGARDSFEELTRLGERHAPAAARLAEEVRGAQRIKRLWVIVVAASCALLLVIGRYRLVERVSTFMVFLFTLFTLVAVGALYWTQYSITPANLADGLVFKIPDNLTTAFAAFGIIGVGASELLYYPYWCLEKGYARFVGPREETPEWHARAAGWIRVMKLDAWLSMIIYTIGTIAFYLLGAAVLHAQDLEVGDLNMIETLSKMYEGYEGTFGASGYMIFLIGAFMVLYSTFFVSTGSNGRLFADALSIYRVWRYRSPAQRERMVKFACVLIPTVTATLFLIFEKPVSLVLVGGIAQALMLPFLAFAALYLRYRRTDRELLPGTVWTVFLWIAFLLMATLGGYQLVEQLAKAF